MARTIIAMTLTLGLALAPASALAQDHVIDETIEASILFVLSAPSGSVDGDTLTLERVPLVVYFGDRPARIAGHMTVDQFVRDWDGGVGSFADVPPNAVLSVLDATGPQDSVIELTSAELDGDTLRFGFTVLEGSPPQGAIGPAALFIDKCDLRCAILIATIAAALLG